MKKGFTAGNFDILHPGYIQLFKECKANCDRFTILLQTDPSIERPEKLQPILSTEERIEQLMSNIYIDEVLVYTYEKELLKLIQKNNFDIRFLGDDYVGKSYTGDQLGIPVHFVNRDHGWSTTKFKNIIAESLKERKGNN
ncbi:MAG: adenylyltransferase/cytidyltransferase family protein [Flavobacteriaceae bacterium]